MALAGLGLTGLGIDYIRHSLDPSAAPPRWPLGLSPPADFPRGWVVACVALAVAAFALLHMGVRYAAALHASRLVQRIVVDLRSTVYEKLQSLSFRFYDSRESGSIINRVTGDVQAMRAFVDGVVVQSLVILLSLVIYVVYMLGVHVGLTLACLASTPLLWMGSTWFSRQVRPLYVKNSGLADGLVLALSESVQGVQVIKGFSREEDAIERFQQANGRVRDGKRRVFRKISVYQPLIGFLTQLNLAILLAYGGWLVARGEIRLGDGLFVFANLLQQFGTQVGQIANIANSVQQSLTGARRVFEVLDEPLEITSPPQAIRRPQMKGGIRFEGVTFGYDPRTPVLTDVDFEVRPGQKVAIVGPTGSGKSTLLSLIPRFYDPSAGRVLVDGRDVRALDLGDLRRQVGVVFQESFLFSNTVAANIAFGAPDASRERIERAARIAAVHDAIIELPRGYDTVIGEYGSNLSGGQRQRLAIARAILHDPPILLLDDALASVDPETEHEILLAMELATQGRTTFIVSHRLAALRGADFAIVLDQGRVAQIGAHDELLAAAGHYRRSARLQLDFGRFTESAA